jgi:hypothetical protein
MFDLPLLEDANSVQVGLMKVIQMLGSEYWITWLWVEQRFQRCVKRSRHRRL